MKTWGVILVLALLGALPLYAQDELPAATVIDDFDSGYDAEPLTEKWWTYSDDMGSTFAASLDTEMVYNGAASMNLTFDVAVDGYAGIGFDYGQARDWQAGEGVVFWLRASSVDMPLNIVLHLDDDTQTSSESPGVTPFGCFFRTPPGSDQDWTLISLPWSCFERLYWLGEAGITEFTPNPVVGFEAALQSIEGEPITGSIWIDDIRVISETNLNEAPPTTDFLVGLPTIHASQVGYRPQDPKWFVATSPVETFSIVDDASGDVVYSGTVEHVGFDADARQEIYRGDFSAFTTPGMYRVVLPTDDTSYPFTIGDDVFDQPLWLAARVFYLQRSGVAIQDGAISGVDLAAGHLEPALLWDDRAAAPVDVSGGWYDAGDFGRYVPTAAFAINQLLYGFNANPEFFADGSLNIPESGNGLPDLLDEIRWELEWLLKMQREDGAVHHKVTGRDYADFGSLPAEDTAQEYVFAVSSADTAYFAAATAQAAQTFQAYDADYAATLLAAAERAWNWLEQHPEQVPPGGFQNPPPSEYPRQGGYDFVSVEAVPRLWAAAELLRTTGDARYETAFAQYFAAVTPDYRQAMSWANSYPMGLYAYLTAENTDPALRDAVAAVFQAQANAIYDVSAQSGYNVALSDQVAGFEYVWGSNQVALAHGLYLQLANELFPDARYEPAALAQIQYVLGVNPLAKAYISGIGADPMLRPHHNVSFRMQTAFPGFITEGANSQDSGGDAVLENLWAMNLPVALRYQDDWQSWATNEPTIDANATFVALLASVID